MGFRCLFTNIKIMHNLPLTLQILGVEPWVYHKDVVYTLPRWTMSSVIHLDGLK